MTAEERFAAIETGLQTTSQTLRTVAESQALTQTLLKSVAEAQLHTQTMLGEMAQSVTRYVDSADARMKRIEANLDALIRAITAEHSNGKQS